LAWDAQLARFVVLKLLHPAFEKATKEAEHTLLNEARIISQLENHHVVRIYELGQLGRVSYIAMEDLRGITLTQMDEQMGVRGVRLRPPVAAAIIRQACLGLHAAHELPTEVVHRDVSHNNIVITRDSVKVIDFGIARAKNRVGKSFSEGNQ